MKKRKVIRMLSMVMLVVALVIGIVPTFTVQDNSIALSFLNQEIAEAKVPRLSAPFKLKFGIGGFLWNISPDNPKNKGKIW